MRIIGCDLHARQQSLAMLETTTGEVVEVTLKHEGGNVREFYSSLPRPVRAGIEATGSMQWFFESHGRAGNRMSGRASGTDSRIRAAEAEKRSARCRFDSEAAGRKSLSGEPRVASMVGIFNRTACLRQKPKASSPQQYESAKRANPQSLSTRPGLDSTANNFALASRR